MKRLPGNHYLAVLLGVSLTGCAAMRTQQCGVPPRIATEDAQPAPQWVAERLAKVSPELNFDVNAYSLREPERNALGRAAPPLNELLRDFPELVIVVEGYCDDRGSTDYNLQLGKQRAGAVRGALVSFGFPADRLRTVSFGDNRPQCFTQDEACRQKNRRVRLSAAQRRG